jgi:hypothetical protein
MSLRDEFRAEVRSAIGKCYDLGYIPSRFERMIELAHPVEVAKKLVVSGEFQHGICELTKLGHQELTIEGIMQQKWFSPLFTKAELQAAAWRLANVPAT